MLRLRQVAGFSILCSAMVGFLFIPFRSSGVGYSLDYCVEYFPLEAVMCISFILIACSLSTVGGILALVGDRWNLSLGFSLFGVLNIGPYFLATLFGIVGIIYLVLSKDEFTKVDPRYSPELIRDPTTRNPPTGPG